MTPHLELPLDRIRALAGNAQFLESVRGFYAALEDRISEHHPLCRNRGICCRFGEFGHRLYVTPVELAYFIGTLARQRKAETGAAACPYQVDGLCEPRSSRPMGCRIFFCESAGQGGQENLSEVGLQALRTLHERFDLPYAYVEWLDGLAQVTSRD
jgi:hypothetical protein